MAATSAARQRWKARYPDKEKIVWTPFEYSLSFAKSPGVVAAQNASKSLSSAAFSRFFDCLRGRFFGGSLAGGAPAAVGGPNNGALLRLLVEPDFRRSSSASRSMSALSFFSSRVLRPMLSRSSMVLLRE